MMIQTKQNQAPSIKNQNEGESLTSKKDFSQIKKDITKETKNTVKQYVKKSYEGLSQLVFQYKLTLEYSPALGIYILPQSQNFYNWQGYYKDAKLKGTIKFDQSNKIREALFLTPVFHPLVDFKSGKLDLKKLRIGKNQSEVFTFLLALKEMFINELYLSIKGSLNQEAVRIYQKSEVLFIQKVFETTVIPSQYFNFDDIEENQQVENILEQEEQLEQLRQKIKEIISNSSEFMMDYNFQSFQKDKLQPMELKVKRFVEMILS